MNFRWKIQGKAHNMKDILNYIIQERGLTKQQMMELINNKIQLHDPFLFEDMRKVVDKILLAIKQGKRMCIIGD